MKPQNSHLPIRTLLDNNINYRLDFKLMSNNLRNHKPNLRMPKTHRPSGYYELKRLLAAKFNLKIKVHVTNCFKIDDPAFSGFHFFWTNDNYIVVCPVPFSNHTHLWPWTTAEKFMIKLKRYKLIE